MKNLTIIIVTYHTKKNVLMNCLNSINKKIKILIVENSKNFKNKDLFLKKFKNIKILCTGVNLGYGKANNIGLNNVKTNFAFILNPDVVLKNNTIDELNRNIQLNKKFSILSPISSNIKYPNYKRINNDEKLNRSLKPFEVKSIDGYAMLFNIKKIDLILKKKNSNKNKKYFDENFFMYLENDDICKRVAEKKGSILIVPSAKITHLGGKAVNPKHYFEVELSRNWHWIWSKFYFNKKHYGYLKAFIKSFPILITSTINFFYYFVINNKLKKKIYIMRFLGLLNSMLCKKSWYRPKV